jgi:hypothetical protein
MSNDEPIKFGPDPTEDQPSSANPQPDLPPAENKDPINFELGEIGAQDRSEFEGVEVAPSEPVEAAPFVQPTVEFAHSTTRGPSPTAAEPIVGTKGPSDRYKWTAIWLVVLSCAASAAVFGGAIGGACWYIYSDRAAVATAEKDQAVTQAGSAVAARNVALKNEADAKATAETANGEKIKAEMDKAKADADAAQAMQDKIKADADAAAALAAKMKAEADAAAALAAKMKAEADAAAALAAKMKAETDAATAAANEATANQTRANAVAKAAAADERVRRVFAAGGAVEGADRQSLQSVLDDMKQKPPATGTPAEQVEHQLNSVRVQLQLIKRSPAADQRALLETAVQSAQEAVKSAKQAANPTLTSQAQLLLGRAFEAQDDFDQAESTFQQGADEAKENSLKADFVGGIARVRLARYHKSKKTASVPTATPPADEAKPEEGSSCENEAAADASQEDETLFNGIIALNDQAIALKGGVLDAEVAGFLQVKANALIDLANLYKSQKKTVASIEALNQSAVAAKKALALEQQGVVLTAELSRALANTVALAYAVRDRVDVEEMAIANQKAAEKYREAEAELFTALSAIATNIRKASETSDPPQGARWDEEAAATRRWIAKVTGDVAATTKALEDTQTKLTKSEGENNLWKNAEMEWAIFGKAVASLVGYTTELPKNPGRWNPSTSVLMTWLNGLEAQVKKKIPPPTDPGRKAQSEVVYLEGVRFYQTGAYSQAFAKLSQAIELYPQDARYFYYRALTQYASTTEGESSAGGAAADCCPPGTKPAAPTTKTTPQTVAADSLKDAIDDVYSGMMLELKNYPDASVVSETLARVQGARRRWLEETKIKAWLSIATAGKDVAASQK